MFRQPLAAAAVLLLLLIGHAPHLSAEALITAAGSTFAYPLYSKRFRLYARVKRVSGSLGYAELAYAVANRFRWPWSATALESSSSPPWRARRPPWRER